MDVLVGVAALCPLSALLAWRLMKWRVNCWFCNGNQWVGISKKNSFVCSSCGQYNGFTPDGDYNRVIPAQHRNSNKRFCVSSRPDVVPDLDENGLCEKCNGTMAKITRLLSQFDCADDENYQLELDDYKYRLEKTYPLCERCILNVQKKLQADKRKYGHLSSFMSPKPSSSRRTGAKQQRKSRRVFFGGGWPTTVLHVASFVLCVSLFSSRLTALADSGSFDVPSWFPLSSSLNSLVNPYSTQLSLILLILHTLSFFTSKCRMNLTDLLCIPMLLCFTYSFVSDSPSIELPLIQLVLSSMLVVLFTSVLFLPRKRKHRKRVNNPISSAFSVASTPLSQCSSQARDNMSMMEMMDKTMSPNATTHDMDWEPSLASEPILRHRGFASEKTPSDRTFGNIPRMRKFQLEKSTPSYAPSLSSSHAPSYAPSLSSSRAPSFAAPSHSPSTAPSVAPSLSRPFHRETSPSDLSTRLSSFALSSPSQIGRSPSRQGPFPSLSFNPSVRSAHLSTPSVFTSVSAAYPFPPPSFSTVSSSLMSRQSSTSSSDKIVYLLCFLVFMNLTGLVYVILRR